VRELNAELFDTHHKYNLFFWAAQNDDTLVAEYLANATDKLWEQFQDETTELHADILVKREAEIANKLISQPYLILASDIHGVGIFEFSKVVCKNSKIANLLVDTAKKILRLDTTPKDSKYYFFLANLTVEEKSKSILLMQKSIELTWQEIAKAPESEHDQLSVMIYKRLKLFFRSYNYLIKFTQKPAEALLLQQAMANRIQGNINQYIQTFTNQTIAIKTYLSKLYNLQLAINSQLADIHMLQGEATEEQDETLFSILHFENAQNVLKLCLQIIETNLSADHLHNNNTADLQQKLVAVNKKVTAMMDSHLATPDLNGVSSDDENEAEIEGESNTSKALEELKISINKLQALPTLTKAQTQELDKSLKYLKKLTLNLRNSYIDLANLGFAHANSELSADEHYSDWASLLQDLEKVKELYEFALKADDDLIQLGGTPRRDEATQKFKRVFQEISTKQDFLRSILGISLEHPSRGASAAASSGAASSSYLGASSSSSSSSHHGYQHYEIDEEEEEHVAQAALRSSSAASSSAGNHRNALFAVNEAEVRAEETPTFSNALSP